MNYRAIDGGQKGETFGYFLMLLSGIFMTGINVTVRGVTTLEGLSVPNMIFLRSLTHVLFCIVATFAFLNPRHVFDVPRKHMPLLILRGLFATGCLVLSYKALSLVPLAVITSVYFLDPVFTMLISYALLAEGISLKELLGAAVSVAGIILVANPTFLAPWNIPAAYRYGIGLELISTFLAGCTLVSVRALAKVKIHYMMNTFAFGIPSLIMGIALGGTNLPLNRGLLFAFLGSISGFFAHVFMSMSLQYCRASTGALISNVNLPLAFLLGVVLLGETPHLVSLGGAVLVIAGCVIIGLASIEKEKSELLLVEDAIC